MATRCRSRAATMSTRWILQIAWAEKSCGLWVASVDFREDVVGSENLMQRQAENYRKIRNTFRYILGNLYDFHPQRDSVPFEQMEALDQYMLRQTCAMAADVVRWYDEFEFHKVSQRVNQFCHRGVERVLFRCAQRPPVHFRSQVCRAGARRKPQYGALEKHSCDCSRPIMSFTCDEIWPLLPAMLERQASVHLAKFPVAEDILGGKVAEDDPKQREDWTALHAVRDEVLKALEEARNSKQIGGSLEAQVTVSAADPVYSVLKRYADQLRYLFIVSAVTLVQGSGNGSGAVSIQVAKAPGQKCERCWNYSTHVGEDKAYPTVCERCSAVLREIESERPAN